MNVLFFPSTYCPPEEVKKALNFYQEQLTLYHAELAFKSRDFTKFQKFIFKEQSHNRVRKIWRLIKYPPDEVESEDMGKFDEEGFEG